MDQRPFLDRSNKPTEPALQTALADMYPGYQEILGLASAFVQAWTFTKSSGWMLKLHDRKKALLYLIPLQQGFKISLTLRENERETFLQDGELGYLQDRLAAARKYPEGFALQFDLTSPDEFHPFRLFVKKLIAIRV